MATLTGFKNRADAGRQLAAALTKYKGTDAVILALPRGGVPVAAQVAKALHLPLDLALVRKIGAPGYPEVGIGAVVDGSNPQIVLNEDMLDTIPASRAYIEMAAKRELAELERRRAVYRTGKPPPAIAGRTVILVDDGIATGGTVRAALRGLARGDPTRRVLAVPVAPFETIESLRREADEVVCLIAPVRFYAVGAYYEEFDQTGDDEVIRLLNETPDGAPVEKKHGHARA